MAALSGPGGGPTDQELVLSFKTEGGSECDGNVFDRCGPSGTRVGICNST